LISTRDLSELPGIEGLRRTFKSLATLDAILSPEWEYRSYSYNAAWASDAEMGSMRNGAGDTFFAHFSPAGCWLLGFAHEYPMSPYRKNPPKPWPGVIDAVPLPFAACLKEPAFMVEDVTFCIWRQCDDANWEHGPISFPNDHEDPDGSAFLLSELDGKPETYQEMAKADYEREVDLAVVAHVFKHQPLTPEIVAALNPEVSFAELARELDEIGYLASGRIGRPCP
jgi:hypothetical protein